MNSLFIFLVVVFTGLFFDIENIFLYCIVFSFLHEAGHIIAYLLCYKDLPKINISIFGFRMEINIFVRSAGEFNICNMFILFAGNKSHFQIIYYFLGKSDFIFD